MVPSCSSCCHARWRRYSCAGHHLKGAWCQNRICRSGERALSLEKQVYLCVFMFMLSLVRCCLSDSQGAPTSHATAFARGCNRRAQIGRDGGSKNDVHGARIKHHDADAGQTVGVVPNMAYVPSSSGNSPCSRNKSHHHHLVFHPCWRLFLR